MLHEQQQAFKSLYYVQRTCEGFAVRGKLPEQYAVRIHVTGPAAAAMHQQLRRLQNTMQQ
jgi:hypothetical protein